MHSPQSIISKVWINICLCNCPRPITYIILQKTNLIDHQTLHGYTALHLATERGHTSVVEILLAHGADVNIASVSGMTCIEIAIGHMSRQDVNIQTTPTLNQVIEVAKITLVQTQKYARNTCVFWTWS